MANKVKKRIVLRKKRKVQIIALSAVLIGSITVVSIGLKNRDVNNIIDKNGENNNQYYNSTNASNNIDGGNNNSKDEKSKEELQKQQEQEELMRKRREEMPLANKENVLPSNYVPEDLKVVKCIQFVNLYTSHENQLRAEAADALEVMITQARKEGLTFYGASGYRSYEAQTGIYKSNLQTYGYEHTNKYVAKPGTSEHQTGLALDITNKAGIKDGLIEEFAHSREGEWIAHNCYKYGFVVRYPKDKENITGYQYEPWHIRYVGKGASEEMYNNNQCLEEYLGVATTEHGN